MLGLARYDAQDAVGAEDAARRAVELAPSNGRAHMLLASIHLDRHEVPEAQRELHRYLELEPTGEWAGDAKALLGP
jgi:Flp pilus assembly protein TadD